MLSSYPSESEDANPPDSCVAARCRRGVDAGPGREPMTPATRVGLAIRPAREADLDDIHEMLDDFVKGHPAETHSRSRSKLREAYFGPAPVGRLLVATRGERVIGMGQWTLIYDMFWSAYGGNVEWLYVRPEYRRSGVVAAIVAEISAQVRNAGGEFLRGGGSRDAESLYERVAMGWQAHECYVSAEAFQSLADLAGLAPRDIIRRLPEPGLNQVAARVRGPELAASRTRLTAR